MRTIFTLLLALFCGSITVSAQPANGIYSFVLATNSQQIEPAIKTQDGETFFLGQKHRLDIKKTYLYSQNNENSRFYFSLDIPYDEKITVSQFILLVDGTAYSQSSSGSSDNIESSIGFVVEGRKNAEQVAEFFKTSVVYRKHPKHHLLVEFTPTKPVFENGEEVSAKLTIKNVGTETVSFMKGGRNRSTRDNQYVFSARNASGQVADIGSSMHFGGMAVRRVLKPGEVFEDTISLSKWFAFDAVGIYEIHGSYYLDFKDPTDEGWKTIWEDWVTADFLVRVK